MVNRMRELSLHYESCRKRFPDDKLIILFDIDGTILDQRYTLKALLESYDKNFHTDYFRNLNVAEIDFPEECLEEKLVDIGAPYREIGHILSWYYKHRWSTWAILEAHKPFPGIMEVIRWFQMQKNTYVGLNTGRIERLREETLVSINKLGEEYRVKLESDLLVMNKTERKASIVDSKIAGIRKFRERGYKVIAMVDNELANLEKISKIDDADELLLLQGRSLFFHKRSVVTPRPCEENMYDLAGLIPEHGLPGHIQFVRENVHDTCTLDDFLLSDIQWADVSHVINSIYYHRKFCIVDVPNADRIPDYIRILEILKQKNKGIRMGPVSEYMDITGFLETVNSYGFDSELMWFKISLDRSGAEDIKDIRNRFPDSIIECQLDFLSTLLLSQNKKTEALLDSFYEWGINRFGISWQNPCVKATISSLDRLGFDVTLNDVSGLESFLRAVLLAPQAIASDFSFRGRGHDSARDQKLVRSA